MLAEVLFLSSTALSMLLTFRLFAVIDVALAPVYAGNAIHRCLQDPNDDADVAVRWAREPLGAKRDQLQIVMRALERTGRRLDRASQGHPLASVVLGCGRHVRRFLMGKDALTTRCPIEIAAMLTEAQVVLTGLATPDRAAALASSVGAFGKDGQPVPELRAKIPGRWALLVGRTGDSLDRYARIATTAWAIFSFIVVAILIATNNLDLTTFQLQK